MADQSGASVIIAGMGKLGELELVKPAGRGAWRRWLAANHAESPGIWLVLAKGDQPGLHYEDAVEEALCFGWIDSTARSLDEHRYKQLLTPRKPSSVWSALNKERVARLQAEGKMQSAGQAAIDVAKANGMWAHLDVVEALEVPADLAAALRRTKGATAAFNDFPPGSRKQILYWIHSAKRPETRAKRIAETAQAAGEGRRARG